MRQTIIHFLHPSPTGPVRSTANVQENKALGATILMDSKRGPVEVSRYAIACAPTKSLPAAKQTNGTIHMATGETVPVTCEKCKATQQWKDREKLRLNSLNELPDADPELLESCEPCGETTTFDTEEIE